MPVSKSFSANTKIKSADINTNFSDVDDKFDTSTGHEHNGTDSKLIFPGAIYKKEASIVISQAQSTTVSRLTITGIANEDAGVIKVTCGGNVGAVDRASRDFRYSYYKTGGTVNFSSVAVFGSTGGATANNIVIVAVNSAGNIVIQTQLGAFGAGNFIGNMSLEITKNTTGLVLTP